MSDVRWKASAVSTVMTTVLNSLANAAAAVESSVIDNTTDLNEWDDLELYIAGLSTAAEINRGFNLYLVPADDGTNYADGSGLTPPPYQHFVGCFRPSQAVNTAQRMVLRQVRIPPTKFKYVFENQCGKTLAASGNTLKRVGYKTEFLN